MSQQPPAPEPLPVAVPDSHCHLDAIDTPVADAVDAARAVGIGPLITAGDDVASSRWCAQTAAEHAEVYAAVAVHPNPAGRGAATDEALAEIARLARAPGVVAVGETGLDHYRTGPPGYAAQEVAFRAHIAIAKETSRALVIHDRDAHDDVLRVLAEEGPPARTVFHCFSGDAAMARACASAGYFCSFAGNVTFASAGGLRAAAAAVPLEQLLVETDAPYLTPVPYRGRPNAPYLVPLTVRALAGVTRTDLDRLCAALAANTARAFDLAG